VYNAMCVKGHTLIALENSEVEKQCRLREAGVIDCVEAVDPKDCPSCQRESIYSLDPEVMVAQDD